MADNKIRLWIGIGSYLVLSTGAGAAPVADAGQTVTAASAHGDHSSALKAKGGEGGEGGEAGYTNEDPDQVFAVNLLLTKGHLHIAHEMAGLGNWDYAGAHAQHPAAETYDNLKPELEKRGAAPFEAELDALVEQIIEKKTAAQIGQAYDAVIAKIDAAHGVIEAGKRTSPSFTMTSVMALLKQASAEYAIGVKDGKIVNLQEYQDASGFIWVADQMIAALDKTLPGMAEITAELAKLKAVWSPSARMDSMVTPEADILGGISRIELKAGKIR